MKENIATLVISVVLLVGGLVGKDHYSPPWVEYGLSSQHITAYVASWLCVGLGGVWLFIYLLERITSSAEKEPNRKR